MNPFSISHFVRNTFLFSLSSILPFWHFPIWKQQSAELGLTLMLKLVTMNSPLSFLVWVGALLASARIHCAAGLSPPLSVLCGLPPRTVASTVNYPCFLPPAQTLLLSPSSLFPAATWTNLPGNLIGASHSTCPCQWPPSRLPFGSCQKLRIPQPQASSLSWMYIFFKY